MKIVSHLTLTISQRGTQIVIRLEALDEFGNPIDTKTVLWTIEEKAAPLMM